MLKILPADVRAIRNSARERVRLSRTSKLGTFSWSLQALETCPGSVDGAGNLVDACRGCYATTGFYMMPDAIRVRDANREDWQREGWVDDMVAALIGETHFRWFDSGDMYSIALAEKILQVMERTPGCKHWLPTRMYKFAKYRNVIALMQSLSNVVVRFSSDSATGGILPGMTTSTIFPGNEPAPAGSTVCEAYKRGGKCADCRACYDRNVTVIAYPAHGTKMAKVIRMLAVA